jgi:FkbM family methyltransferase
MSIISPRSISAKFNLVLNGVIHIGEHKGQEIDDYLELSLKKIYVFEVNDEHAPILNSYAERFIEVKIHYVEISCRQRLATFKLMSEYQSLSLFQLQVHADFYSDINKTSQSAVEAKTLDSILIDQSSHDINYLNIDIKGAGLAALRGAQQTLLHIDLITIEVNFAKTCEGCPLIEEVDLFLFDRGFIRVETSTPFHPTWGHAAYVRSSLIQDISLIDLTRRHAVTMSSFGHVGRFANQLFQYLFLVLYGLRSGCKPVLPERHATEYLNLSLAKYGRVDLLRLPWLEITEDLLRLETAEVSLLETNAPARDVDIFGYFQGVTDIHRLHKQFVRTLLAPRLNIEDDGQQWLRQVRSRFRRVIGLHIRRGDYVEFDVENIHTFARVPTELYLHWLRAQFREGDGIFISTDDENEIAKFGDFPILTELFPRSGSFAGHHGDFYLLSRCDIAAYCNSSWSLMSALLASPEQEAYIIDFGRCQFVPFDPWNETWFWRRFRSIRGNISAERHDQNVAFLVQVAETRRDLENKVAHLGNKVAHLENKIAHLENKVAHSENRVARFAQQTTTLMTRLTAIEASTIWRATRPLRTVATRVPAPIRRHLRQIVKAGYWMMTPHKIPARIAFIRKRDQI